MSTPFTPQWWIATYRASCEMTVWVEAATSEEARRKLENYEYEEMTAWEVRPSTYAKLTGRKGHEIKPAPGFVPERDNS